MINFNIGRRGKPAAIGLLRTAPFIAAGILSMVLFYSQATQNFDWQGDTVILLIFVFLCWTVFFAVSQQLPYSKKNIIDDLLVSALFYLGSKYRINIMELKTSEHNAFDSFFKISYGHGYNDPYKYKEKITMDMPGASQAYKDREVKYLSRSELRVDIDQEIKHLWSAPIKNRRGDSVAVINVDNIADDDLPNDIIEANKKSIEQLADLISFYWGIPS